MKIIEAMKQIKDLQRKCSDLEEKIGKCSADYEHETPLVPDQRKAVAGWVQSHSDLCKEILRLRIGIQKANLETNVDIELGGKRVTKTIAEWIHRRRELAFLELKAYKRLTDRNLQEGHIKQSTDQIMQVKLRRYYDPEARDKKIDELSSEPLMIDSRLEVVNAVTDIIE